MKVTISTIKITDDKEISRIIFSCGCSGGGGGDLKGAFTTVVFDVK